MKHGFEKVGLPGCATCHSNHKILSAEPRNAGHAARGGLRSVPRARKVRRHLGGAQVAETLRADLEGLDDQIQQAHATIEKAEQLGMEVSGPRFDLHKANDALQNARVQIHSFAVEPVEKTLKAGRETATEVQDAADAALQEYHYRRIWLAASLLPILVVIVLLVLHIRSESGSTGPA